MENIDELLEKSKIQLLCKKDAVFLSTIVCSLDFQWDNTIRTACTNGLFMKISPDFFTDLPEAQRVTLLAHEADHVALRHMVRVGERNFRLFNMAADYVINLGLKDAGYAPIDGWLIDEQ